MAREKHNRVNNRSASEGAIMNNTTIIQKLEMQAENDALQLRKKIRADIREVLNPILVKYDLTTNDAERFVGPAFKERLDREASDRMDAWTLDKVRERITERILAPAPVFIVPQK